MKNIIKIIEQIYHTNFQDFKTSRKNPGQLVLGKLSPTCTLIIDSLSIYVILDSKMG
jgi:hypothetical protein